MSVERRTWGAASLGYALLLLSCSENEPDRLSSDTSLKDPPPAAIGSKPAKERRTKAFLHHDPEQLGIDFVHRRYQTESIKYLPETAGSGMAMLDYDRDGDLDLYFVQCCPLPGYQGTQAAEPDRLYRNDGGFRFADVTRSAGLGDLSYGMGVTCPDLDNDGFPEIYVANLGPNVLYHNNGDGTFENVSGGSGIDDPSWSTAAGWVDFDRDGDLDLYLCNYAVCDLEHYKVCSQGKLISYCHPDTLESQPDRLFRNDDGLHFTDITVEAGIVDPFGKGLAVVPFDHDGDGWIDLFIANDADPNFLWLNRGEAAGGLQFEEVAGLCGAALSGKGSSQSCMGTDIADIDNDLDFDIFSANFAKEPNVLYERIEDFYEDRIYPRGLGEASYKFTGFGAEFLDFDRDADLDLVVVNGHIIDIVEQLDSTQTFAQEAHLYVNRGDGVFDEKGASIHPFFGERHVARGLCVGDVDDDGDLDLLVSNNDEAPSVLQNLASESSPGDVWIGFRLVGRKSARDAIGARLEVQQGDRRRVDEVRGSTSYLCWLDLRLYFGFGPGDKGLPCTARIRWPSGRNSEHQGLASCRYHVIEEPIE